ncbi:cobalt chelatase [Aquitalea sp. ASV15]|uniref:cobaltochelatase CobT-related protein n=1 Tax=Aquitalea sp. ASV15 TaxID=2795104 RepID=UPI0018EC4512|nr:cobalt chelatase [Aquitalea sp. ASV15]
MTTSAPERAQAWKLDQLCSGVVAALCGDAMLHFRGGRLYRGARLLAVPAPHLRWDGAAGGLADWRGLTDALAMRQLHSSPVLHARLRPDDALQRRLFDWLEQLRVESLHAADMVGMANNLQQCFYRWSRRVYHAGLTETEAGMLLYTLMQMCWSRLHARPVLAETEDHIESSRAGLLGLLGGDLAGLRRQRQCQEAYALHALQIARQVSQRLQQFHALQEGAAEDSSGQTDADRALSLLMAEGEDEAGGHQPLPQALSGSSTALAGGGKHYRIFSGRYDVEWRAASKVRPAQLHDWRVLLDQRIKSLGVNISRLARMLAMRLAQPQMDGWRGGEEEGRLDGRRLAQLVSSPAERSVFRQEQYRLRADCAVTLLVDCSGSMKRFAESLAILLDVLLRVLDQAGISCELLGFTTASWNGGRALAEWRAAGCPPHSGRLNERCHLVFKNFAQGWRRARQDVAALLKTDLYREGLDGEAVEWACQRLSARREGCRLLLVISDGSPTDSATVMANDPFYLDNHLKSVLARHEQEGQIDIIGVGLGLDLSPFYRRNLAIDLSQGVNSTIVAAMTNVLMQTRRR